MSLPVVHPGPRTFPGTEPATRVWEQVRVHHVLPGQAAVGSDVSATLLGASITRGGDATATVLTPEVGTATLTLEGDHTRALTPNRHLAVLHHTGARLFTGKILNAVADDEQTPGGGWRAVTVVRLADAVAELANTKRYSVQSSSETEHQRLARLMASAKHVPYTIKSTHPDAHRLGTGPGGVDILHRAYIHESDLARHLSMLADGALVGWYVDATGRVTFARATRDLEGECPTTTPLVITDGSRPTDPTVDLAGRPTTSPVRIRRGFTTDDLATVVTVKRYGRRTNPDSGEDEQRIDTFGPVVSTDVAADWGRVALEVDVAVTNNPGPDELEHADSLVANHYAGLRYPHHRPRMVRLNAGRNGWPALELLDVLDVLMEGTLHRLYVCGLTHTITATRWLVDVELAATGADTRPGQPNRPPIVLEPPVNPDPDDLTVTATTLTTTTATLATEEKGDTHGTPA